MALTNIGTMYWPPTPSVSYANTAARLLDAADEKIAAIFSCPATGSIRKIHFATMNVTTGATVDVRLETVSTSDGTPTGTLFGTTTNVSHVINNTDDNAWLSTAALTADASVTAGNIIAAVIVNPAVSPGNFNIASIGAWGGGNLPYIAHYTTSWAKINNCLRLAVEYSDGTIYPIAGQDPALSGNLEGITTANNYRGNKLYMPFRCRAIGMYWYGYNSGVAGTYTGKLFDTDGATALATITHDTDIRCNAAAEITRLTFASPVTLAARSTYYLGLASDGTATLRTYYYDYGNATVLASAAHSLNYALWSQTAGTPTGTGDWTTTNTRIALVGLIIDQIDVGGGGAANLAGGILQ